MISRYTKEEVAEVMRRVMSEPDSDYIMTDNLDDELEKYIGKYMVMTQLYGDNRVPHIPYIRKMFQITKLIIEQYDGTKITVNVQPNGKDGQTPPVEGDRQTSDNHADCHDEDATAGITKENR